MFDVMFDMCRCSTCHGKFKVSDCEADFGNHNGWELPPYTLHLCPNCEDGGSIDDYFYSEGLTMYREAEKVVESFIIRKDNFDL